MMDLIQRFRDFFAGKGIKYPGLKFLVAASGGIDSSVLCACCKKAEFDFGIAHCNFLLRGEESERDEKFVGQLAQEYGVAFHLKKFDTQDYAAQNRISIQEAARDLRYAWFEELRVSNQYDFILLAHHADDNIETVLMNFLRGTGLRGMNGIQERNGFLLRPLLHVRRKEIENFARTSQLAWIEDSSNQSTKYTRNYFRMEILPAIRKIFPQVDENILDNVHRFESISRLYDLSVDALKKKLLLYEKNQVRIPVKKLMMHQDTSLIYEIIREYGFGEKQVEELIKLSHSGSGKFIASERYQIIRHGNWFIIAEKTEACETIAIDKEECEVKFSDGEILFDRIGKADFRLQTSPHIAQLDLKHVEFPLLLRKWKQGDYFYPLGMRKKKKLARFFIDQKLSKNQKEKIWVLESNKKIIWVLGMRIDDRFRVTDQTKTVLSITYQHKALTR